VSLQGNTYQVDPLLAGHRVELIFDPFDLTMLHVRVHGVPAGTAIPHRIGRHAHVKARPETPSPPPAATGIDYARLVGDAHHAELAHGVNYAALAPTAGELPGQLDLLTDLDVTDLDVTDLDVTDLDVTDLDVTDLDVTAGQAHREVAS
jgi:putative transposase